MKILHRPVKFEAGEENRIVYESLYWLVFGLYFSPWRTFKENSLKIMKQIMHLIFNSHFFDNSLT